MFNLLHFLERTEEEWEGLSIINTSSIACKAKRDLMSLLGYQNRSGTIYMKVTVYKFLLYLHSFLIYRIAFTWSFFSFHSKPTNDSINESLK